MVDTYDLALIFLLLRLRRRTRFFLHLALILNELGARSDVSMGCKMTLRQTESYNLITSYVLVACDHCD
jgi:hypothetical protein